MPPIVRDDTNSKISVKVCDLATVADTWTFAYALTVSGALLLREMLITNRSGDACRVAVLFKPSDYSIIAGIDQPHVHILKSIAADADTVFLDLTTGINQNWELHIWSDKDNVNVYLSGVIV